MIITYLCPALNHPVGGIKVIYRHAEMLATQGIESFIHHPQEPNFRCTWFQHQAKFRLASDFNPAQDFVVIPEVWAAYFGKQCLDLGIKYAIFVQNGYLIHSGMGKSTGAELKKVYESADIILSISENTTEMIALLYPDIQTDRIIRVFPAIGEAFHGREKQKVISFMPRKLKAHADMLCLSLQEYLPPDWRLSAIENMDEQGVARALGESSIFLSFSDLEGLPLPPLEAAFCGNIVVGYVGQGAKEYFHKPLFHEVGYGEFKESVRIIKELVGAIDLGLLGSPHILEEIEALKSHYSKANETKALLGFMARVQDIGRTS